MLWNYEFLRGRERSLFGRIFRRHWIPACAGMTSVRLLYLSPPCLRVCFPPTFVKAFALLGPDSRDVICLVVLFTARWLATIVWICR